MDAELPLHVYENIGHRRPVYMHKCLATSPACKISRIHGSVNAPACIRVSFSNTSHIHAKMFWRCCWADARKFSSYTWNSRCPRMYDETSKLLLPVYTEASRPRMYGGISQFLFPVYMEASFLPHVYTLNFTCFAKNMLNKIKTKRELKSNFDFLACL